MLASGCGLSETYDYCHCTGKPTPTCSQSTDCPRVAGDVFHGVSCAGGYCKPDRVGGGPGQGAIGRDYCGGCCTDSDCPGNWSCYLPGGFCVQVGVPYSDLGRVVDMADPGDV